MSDSITFKYTLTKGDAVRALRFQVLNSKLLWIFAGLYILSMGYVLSGSILSGMAGEKDWYSSLLTLPIYGLLGVAWAAFNWFYPVWTVKNWPAVGVEREVTVSAEGMTMRSPLGYSETAWANYTRMVETDDFFMLFMGRVNFIVIPKRDLAVSGLREFFRARFTDYRQV